MKSLLKLGGIAALYEAIAYLIAMVGYLLVIGEALADDPIQKVAILVENQSFLYILNLFTYILFGIVLILLALALYNHLKVGSPAAMQTAMVIGIIWATVVTASGMVSNIGMGTVVDIYKNDPSQAATVWLAIDSIATGLGGGSGEILGGLWILIISWVALRAGVFSRVLNYLGLLVGLAGLFSVFPVLGEMRGLIFGLGQIPWFIWLGITLLRSEDIQTG